VTFITASGQPGVSRTAEAGAMLNEPPRRDRSRGPSFLVGCGATPSSAAGPWMNSNRVGAALVVESPLILLATSVVCMLMPFIFGRRLWHPLYQA